MFQNVTGIAFETDCELGRPSGLAWGENIDGSCSQICSPAPIPPAPSITLKSGSTPTGSFSGEPALAEVFFETPFSNSNYSIILSGTDARVFTWQSKTPNGFVINTNANGALTGNVDWVAIPFGETS